MPSHFTSADLAIDFDTDHGFVLVSICLHWRILGPILNFNTGLDPELGSLLDIHCSNLDVKDESFSGRTVTYKFDTILGKNRVISSYDIAEELGIDHKRVLIHLKKVGYTKEVDTWGPHELTERNLVKRVLICDYLLKLSVRLYNPFEVNGRCYLPIKSSPAPRYKIDYSACACGPLSRQRDAASPNYPEMRFVGTR
ncbi:Histone-lysine N-methyltransferase SETMAR [Eumeta japonica]|uniref:Histone-lysine N-methyltransferase SETMAR n=1 Tax=Eumeta variegata TaxID=151549 RepID=A0A4C1SVQ6_EUMVA|nr:Histone-lysine N-methyltransferase SETMAR [Eumeta japonica]